MLYFGRLSAYQLHQAIKEKNLDRVTSLLENISKLSTQDKAHAINRQDNLGNSALHYATQMGCVTFINAILALNPDVDAQNIKGNTPLHLLLAGASDDWNPRLDAPRLGPSSIFANNNIQQPQPRAQARIDSRLVFDFTQSAVALFGHTPKPDTRVPNIKGYTAHDACHNNVPYRHILNCTDLIEIVKRNDSYRALKVC